MSIASKVRLTALVALAGFCVPSGSLWSSAAWGQQSRVEWAQPRTAPAKPVRAFGLQPTAVQPAPPTLTPVALPVTNPNSALGSALASCDKASEGFEALALPGARGEVRIDRCYRGRDHLVCSFGALLTEGRSLVESYKKIVDANYPNIANVEGVCGVKPGDLATDLESANDFNARFKALKAEYDARANCAGRVQQSFRDVTLPDMTQAPEILKSMIESIEADMKGVSGLQAQVAALAEKIDASQKAMNTIQKIHRAMCAKNQRVATDTENRATR